MKKEGADSLNRQQEQREFTVGVGNGGGVGTYWLVCVTSGQVEN